MNYNKATAIIRNLLCWALPLCCLVPAAAQLQIRVRDKQTQQPLPARMHLKNANTNRVPRIKDPKKHPAHADHFVFPGSVPLALPTGPYTFELEHGLEYKKMSGNFSINPGAQDEKVIELTRYIDPNKMGWYSGDIDVPRAPTQMKDLMLAEGLNVAESIPWDNRKSYWNGRPMPKGPNQQVTLTPFQTYTIRGGAIDRSGSFLRFHHLTEPVVLNLRQANGGAADADYPGNVALVTALQKKAKGRKMTVSVRPESWDLPLLLAYNLVDAIEVLHGGMRRDQICATAPKNTPASLGQPADPERFVPPAATARWAREIYFHVLNCGFRIPPVAGSGSGKSPNHVGYNRVYAHVGTDFSYDNWWNAVLAGQTFVTNGPIALFRVNNQLPGHVFSIAPGETLNAKVTGTISSREQFSYLEVIQNGESVRSIPFEEYSESGELPVVEITKGGWFTLLIVTDQHDSYSYAMTAPFYVEVEGEPRFVDPKSVDFFIAALKKRASQIQVTDPAKKKAVFEEYRGAYEYFRKLRGN